MSEQTVAETEYSEKVQEVLDTIGGFTLLDTQYSTSHLERFGVVEIPRADYMERLDAALSVDAPWWPLSDRAAADLDRPVSSLAAASPGNEEDGNG